MDFDQTQDTVKKCGCRPVVGRGCCFTEGENGPEAFAREGCFKLHEENWLEEYPQHTEGDIFEVRFKNTRRGFYQNVNNLELKRGDIVAVEAAPGHDIGIISLTGDMVLKQMRRTGFNPQNGEFRKIYRKAKPYDIERWQEAIALEHETMILSRQIAADMGLNMKIGDVEYQGDKIKAIFYYIADERVDFRELIKVFAERFHIRIEMKQIGARQEAGRIGGLGACGRELCCASWMSTFSSVTTGAARAQDLSLNPQKLAGQCSKLKCCMMYEYDAYADARKALPRVREPLQTVDGEWFLVKTDILAGLMTFSSSKDTLSNLTTLTAARVEEIQAANRAGKRVDQLQDADDVNEEVEEPTYRSEEDSITRFDKAKRRKKKNKQKSKSGGDQPQKQQEQKQKAEPKQENPKQEGKQEQSKQEGKQDTKHEQRGQKRGDQQRQRSEQRQRPQQEASAEAAEPRQEGEERPSNNRQNHRRFNRRRRPNGANGQGGGNAGGNE